MLAYSFEYFQHSNASYASRMIYIDKFKSRTEIDSIGNQRSKADVGHSSSSTPTEIPH